MFNSESNINFSKGNFQLETENSGIEFRAGGEFGPDPSYLMTGQQLTALHQHTHKRRHSLWWPLESGPQAKWLPAVSACHVTGEVNLTVCPLLLFLLLRFFLLLL